MPVMRYVGISSLAAALRSPNSGVKLPLLVPYFLWKQRLPHPSTCCPHWKAPSGPPSLLCSFCLHCCCSERPSHFASNHSISNGCSLRPCWWLFFNVVQQSDNCDRLTHLGRVVIFTAKFLDEDFFTSLSKWSTHRVGIAQLTQRCVFSRSSLREAHLRWPSLCVRGVPGKKAVSVPAGLAPRTSPGVLTRSLTPRTNRRT